MQVSTEVMAVLSNAFINGNAVKLTAQLDRKLYEATNKVLSAAGGKWNRSVQAHVFQEDPGPVMDQIILTGKITDRKQEFGFFPTPPEIVDRLLARAEITAGMKILEPSAGAGNILRGILEEGPGRSVTCYELDPRNVEYLESHAAEIGDGFTVKQADFLKVRQVQAFDRVVMNPPFSKRADVNHVSHAARFLKPGGLLVAVMSAGTLYRQDRLTELFRGHVERHNGRFEKLPDSAFQVSGTQVATVMVTVRRPYPAHRELHERTLSRAAA